MSVSDTVDGSLAPPRELLLLSLAEGVPGDVVGWAERDFEIETVSDVSVSLELIHENPGRFAVILIYVERGRVDEALRACRGLRRDLNVPTLLASEDPIRVADRVAALEAGASDFLSSPLSVVELASKIEHAIAAGGARIAESSGPSLRVVGHVEILDPGSFAFEIERRLSHPSHSIFTLVSVRAPEDAREVAALGEVLLRTAREDEGDCVGLLPRGFGVVLQGASIRQAESFLGRVRSALPDGSPTLEWAAQSGVADAARILGEFGDPRAFKSAGSSA